MKKFLAFLFIFVLFFPAQTATAKTFRNCVDLKAFYKYGVAQTTTASKAQGGDFFTPKVLKSVYLANKKLDTDKDGVVCEVKRPKPSSSSAEAISVNPSPGRLCKDLGAQVAVFDRNYACVREGTQNRWSAGSLNKDFVYTTDQGFNHARAGYCQIDFDAGTEWAGFQTFFKNQLNRCPGPLRYLNYTMGAFGPSTPLAVETTAVSPCQVGNMSGQWVKGFSSRERRIDSNVLGRDAVIQIIPIYAPDTSTPQNSPRVDYEKYFNFVEDFVKSLAGSNSKFEIRVPDQYFEFNKPLKDFGVSHELSGPHPTALGEIVRAIDSKIDFSGADTALVLVPPGTAHDVWQQGPLGGAQTSEGSIRFVSSQYPETNVLLGQPPKFVNLGTPGWWVHEFFHLGVGLDDHYGDTQQNPSKLTGMGFWGLMSPSLTDMLGWEKWLLEYTLDNQVACISSNVNSGTLWLRPSSVQTDQTKLGILPLGPSKVLVLESIRGAGLNLSLSSDEQGLLVYTVDVSNNQHAFGFDLQYPTSRAASLNGSFPGSKAPLKKGEHVMVSDFKVEVVEAGNFGDVVRISRN